MTTKTRRKAPVKKTITLLTDSVERHQHAVSLYSWELENGTLGGQTSPSTGDAATEDEHSHPWTMDAEGNLVIGEADGHTHEVDEMELTRALAQLRRQMVDVAMAKKSRKTRKAPQAEEDEEEDDEGLPLNKQSRKPRRRLRNGEIHTVSLCRRGINGVRSLLKSIKDGEAEFDLQTTIAKMDNEGLLHALVYVPDLVDHEGDFMSADEIRKMAHNFLLHGGNIDIEHDNIPLSKEDVHIAEHYIVPAGDPKFAGIMDDAGNEIDPTGAWGLILKIHDPDLLAGYELGEWIGVSMAGRAEVELVGKSRLHDTPTPTEDDLNMTPEEMKVLAAEIAKAVAPAVAEAVAPAKPDADDVIDTPANELPEPPGADATEEELEKYLDDLFVAKLDMSKPGDVQKLIKHRREQAAKRAKAEAEAEKLEKAKSDGEGAEETELEKAKRERDEANARIEKLEKASRQPGKDADEDEEDEVEKGGRKVHGLTKSESKQWNLGKQIAERHNKSQRRSSAVA